MRLELLRQVAIEVTSRATPIALYSTAASVQPILKVTAGGFRLTYKVASRCQPDASCIRGTCRLWPVVVSPALRAVHSSHSRHPCSTWDISGSGSSCYSRPSVWCQHKHVLPTAWMAQAGDQQAPRVLSSDFLGDGAAPTTDLILLILNYHLPHRTIRLWTRAKVHVCADGGANRLYDLIPQCFSQDEPDAARSRFVPDVIKGDLDSIRPEVAEFYRSRGAKVVDLSGDQDSTDLMKCLKLDELGLGRERLQASTILALGGLGGRLDHTLCNLNTLCLNPDLDLVLLGDTSIARLVPAGYSCIRPDATVEGPTCGLIPLEAPTTATSTGLKWNLDNHIMKFGGLVSSSNVLVDSEVTVQCDQPLIWTTEFRDA